MKHILLLADGMADERCKQLDGKTPLQYANTPNMDYLARKGRIGMVRTVPEGFPPGSDVANLSVMGYNPQEFYTGRSPLEAVSMGVELKPEDVAFRCNLVTLSDEQDYKQKTMLDYSAGEISSEEARVLIEKIEAELADQNLHFYPGISYRHLMIWQGGKENCELTPPHDIYGKKIITYLPEGEGSDKLYSLMKASNYILKEHAINIARIQETLNPANSIWLWGQGKKPRLTSFENKYGLQGAVISAVDLIKGIGICAGMEVIEVEGATGNIHTNFSGKAAKALKGLDSGLDFIFIHVEAADEAAHQGDLETKIKAIEQIDQKVLGEILNGIKSFKEYQIMVLPDHPTPLRTRTHSADPVPFVIHKSGNENTGNNTFDEETAGKSSLYIDCGHTLMDYFLKKL